MKQHIAVSAIGTDRTGNVHDLTRVISECGGNISESRMASLGSEFAMVLLVSGNWHSLAKLETELKKLADASGLTVNLRRTEPRSARTDMLPYSIDAVCLDQTGIVRARRLLLQPWHRHWRGGDAQLPGRAYRCADVLGADGRQRAEPGASCAPSRGVHGVLRLDEPRRDTRAGEILTDVTASPASSPSRADGALLRSARPEPSTGLDAGRNSEGASSR
jgi:predicted amino acid-binding ACT domain protein